MHRIDGDGHASNLFTEGDPLIPTPATQVTAAWLNAVQEEIVGVVTASGAALSKPDNTQLLTALNARYGRLGVANTWVDWQTINASTSNASALVATGNGTGSGVVAAGGGSTGSNGVVGLGRGAALGGSTTPGAGGLFLGAGLTTIPSAATNMGVYALGGPTSTGGGSSAGHGVMAYGGNPSTGTAGNGGNFNGGSPTSGNNNGGIGVVGNGGAPSGSGTGGRGGLFTGATGAVGVQTTGGAAAAGIAATGGSGAAGGTFAAGTAATASVRQTALSVTNGDVSLSGVTNPNSNVGFSNTLTPANIIKAFGSVSANGSGAATLAGGFNVSAVAISTTNVRVTFATAMADATYAVVATPTSVYGWHIVTRTTTYFEYGAFSWDTNGVPVIHNLSTNSHTFMFQVVGLQ